MADFRTLDIQGKRELARCSTSGEILAELANINDEALLRLLAVNPHTPTDVLAGLAKSPRFWVQVSTAENPNTPPEVLTELAEAANPQVDWVRIMTARNKNTPADVLDKLALVGTWQVRMNVVFNPSTTEETLNTLTNDTDIIIKEAAKKQKTRRAGAEE